MPSVLGFLAEGFEELEVIAPVDVMRRAGVEVTMAALVDGLHVTGRNGVTLHADTTLAAVLGRTYDLVFIPGGPGVRLLRADPRVREIVLQQAAAGGWLAALCAAPTVLHDAGLLQGRRYTAHPSVAGELPGSLPAERVVIDGRIITSRGAGTALEFGLTLVNVLASPAKAQEVATSICT